MGSIKDRVEYHSQGPKGVHIFDGRAPAQEFIIGKDGVEDVSTGIIYNLGCLTYDEEAVIDGRFEVLRVLGKINLISNLRDVKKGDFVYYDREWQKSGKPFLTPDEYRDIFLNQSKSRDIEDDERE